jgi:small subunit ribosomal protein S17
VEQKTRKNKQVRQGTVVSSINDKTVVVLIKRLIKHPVYKKTVKFSKKFHCHDSENQCKVGDEVQIVECKPISKLKRWRLLKVLNTN